VTGARDITGTVDGEVAIDGPLAAPAGRATLRSGDLAVFGDRYTEAAVDLDVAKRVVTAKRVSLQRQNGGELDAQGTVGFGGALDLDVTASSFPLAAIPRLNELPVPIDGQISGKLHLGGDVQNPSVGGYVALMATRVRNILFGNGTLKLEPGGDAIRLSGNFFDRLTVEGYLTVAPRPVLFVRIGFNHMALETLVPELSLIDTKGVISGTVQLTVNGDGLSDAQVRLTELAIVVEPAKRETDEEKRRFEIRNKYPVRLTYVDGRFTFESARLISSAGELRLSGTLAARGSDARVSGKISLDLLEYFARNVFDHTHGEATLDVRLTGPLARPTLAGSLDVRRGAVVLRDADRPIDVPSAHLEITPDAVVAREVVIALDRGTLTASGRLGLKDFRPTDLVATVRGDVSARLLQLALPRYFSEASGLIALTLDVNGPWRNPRVGGRIGLKHVDLMARDLGREIVLRSGAIDLDGATTLADAAVALKDVRGSLDEGEFVVAGQAALAAWQLADLDVHFKALGIPNRVPRVYDLSVNTDLRLRFDEERRLRLDGVVDVVDGRYVQKFDLLDKVISPSRTHVESKPFWAGVPLLANLVLGLQVRSAGAMVVRNNLAEMTLDLALEVGGTLEKTELAGEIRTIEGSVSIPFLRGRFQLQEGGTVAFVRGKEVPKETPEVNIVGETVYTDSREQEHIITLTLHGPLGQLTFDLHSNTGLNTGQCLALLSTGRTTDEVRAMVTGRQEAGAPQGAGAAAAADQALKTITSDFMSMLIEDPVKHTLHLDLWRLELGTESFGVQAGWRFGRHVKVLGSYQYGLLGDSHTDGRAEVKLSDYVLLIPEIEYLVVGQQAQMIEQEPITRGKVQLKLRLNMR
jgi:autotransporter translocation and assembly factor TamB